MGEIRTSIDIDAEPSAVWSILTRLEEYPEWNPFYRWAMGIVERGGALRFYATPPGARPFTFRPRVVSIRTGETLLLRGPIRPFGLLRGEITFALQMFDAGGTRFSQTMRLGGALFLFGGDELIGKIGSGMEAMNRAMRSRLEGKR